MTCKFRVVPSLDCTSYLNCAQRFRRCGRLDKFFNQDLLSSWQASLNRIFPYFSFSLIVSVIHSFLKSWETRIRYFIAFRIIPWSFGNFDGVALGCFICSTEYIFDFLWGNIYIFLIAWNNSEVWETDSTSKFRDSSSVPISNFLLISVWIVRVSIFLRSFSVSTLHNILISSTLWFLSTSLISSCFDGLCWSRVNTYILHSRKVRAAQRLGYT